MTKDISPEIEKLLAKESRGLLLAEIAQRLGVHRHTARKYVQRLAADGRVARRKVGGATICYRPAQKRRAMRGGLWFCIAFFALASAAAAVSDCAGTDVTPCQKCDSYAINVSLYYPNGSLAAYTLNSTLSSAGACSCACYTADCCANGTYKNYSSVWGMGYTYCPVEGVYVATVNANSTQTATEWEGASSNLTAYTVSWDADQNWCTCKVGSGRWSLGGETAATTCCGDDASENKVTETQGTDAPAQFDDGTDACCDAATDCVEADTCYADAATYGTIPNKGYCSSGTWYGGDYSSAACTAVAGSGRWNVGGEVSGTACCGDDVGENKLARVCDGVGCASDPTDDACCDAATDCVWSSTCYANGAAHPTVAGTSCSAGTWTQQNPLWRAQGTNETDGILPPGGSIALAAQGKDAGGLGYAWLETNESGSWSNLTGGSYGSPMNMNGATDWTWSNFSWSNASVTWGKDVAWKIWYNGTSGNTNGTGTMLFLVDSIPYASSSIVPALPVDTDDLNLYATCTDADAGASLTAYWRWWNGVSSVSNGSAAAVNGTQALLNTLDSLNTMEGEQWTAEVWCGDGFANSTSSNASAYIAEGPEKTMQVKLTINNTSNLVHVPGTGDLSASGISVSTSSPGDYYLASYGGGTLYGLVFFYRIPRSISASSTASNHTLEINASMRNSNIFLTFTRGDWNDISKRVDLIRAGTFLMAPMPSFGYGLATKSFITIMAKYADIDISGLFSFGRGGHQLALKSLGGRSVEMQLQ